MHKCLNAHISTKSLDKPLLALAHLWLCLVFPCPSPFSLSASRCCVQVYSKCSQLTTNHIPKRRRKYIRGINADIDI